MAISGLNHRTGTTTAFIRKADIRVRFTLSAHRISNRDTNGGAGRYSPMVEAGILDGAALAWLYDHGDVVERTDDERFVHVKVRLDTADAARFARRRERSPH